MICKRPTQPYSRRRFLIKNPQFLRVSSCRGRASCGDFGKKGPNAMHCNNENKKSFSTKTLLKRSFSLVTNCWAFCLALGPVAV